MTTAMDRLMRYLVGALPEAETEHLDELSVVDNEVAASLRIAEDDLIDAYVRGALDNETRGRFESHYLASPKRRAKVAFAMRFLRAIDSAPRGQEAAGQRTAAPPAVPRRSIVRARVVDWLFAAAPALRVSTAALLLRNASGRSGRP